MKQQLSYLYLSIRDLVAPLQQSLDSMEGLEYLFQKFGWEIDIDEVLFEKINQALVLKETLEKFIAAADQLREKSQTEELDFSDLEVIIAQGNGLIQSIASFEINNISGLDGPLKEVDFWKDIADHLMDDLLVTYFQHHTPIVYAIFHFFGVIRLEHINPLTAGKTSYVKSTIDWGQLLNLVSNPLNAFTNFYQWNQTNTDFKHLELMQNLQRALESLKVHSTVLIPTDDFLSNTAFNPSPNYNIEEKVMEWNIPFLYGMRLTDQAIVDFGLSAIPIPKGDSSPPSGLLIRPVSRGTANQMIGINDDFKLEWKITAEASNLLQLKVFPDHIGLDSGELSAGLAFGFHSTFSKPRYIIGKESTTRLKLEQFSIEFKVLGSPSDPELQLIVKIYGNPGLNATLVFDDSDNFLKETVATQPLEGGFSPEIIWSSKNGITFNGNIAMDSVIPLNKEIGGIKFDTFYFSLDRRNNPGTIDSPSLNLGLTMSGKIGPLAFKVERMGCMLHITPYTRQQLQEQSFSGSSLVFGNLGLDLDYLPPKGIGIALTSEIISGGGFLEFDPDNSQYAGVLTLKLALEKRNIGLVAVGLINTRLPNGEKGFSMLLSISVYFTPEIPLAFGFKLNAVGGLVGIHRTMKVDVLREKIQSGAVKSILFPENVIENAAKIISDIRTVFPPQKKHHVVAPFFKIGYGTPTVVEMDIGVLIEFPFKGRLILLGSLGIYLPSREAEKRLGELHVDILGDVNFAASSLLVEGRLRDSVLTGISLTGGFALMLDWGSDPQFLLSVGGYHPRYKKPARFPEIPRITALIKKGNDIRLSCKYYQAITSNSYQIGFSAELLVKKGNARAYGFLGFDALLQFDPFYFETDIRINVEVSYKGRSFFGIEMEFLLSGPEPWRARGYAKIKVLFFSLKIKFNISWGGEQKAVPLLISPGEILEKLKLQLGQAGNWSGKLPDQYSETESMRSLEEAEKQDQVFLHPSGYLELRQNLLPLNRTIEKMGNSFLSVQTAYQILNYSFGDGDPIDSSFHKPIFGFFSRGQIEDLPENEKLSTPDFDLMAAGIQLVPDQGYDFSTDIQFSANDFEDIILEETGSAWQKSSFNWQEESFVNLGRGTKPLNSARPEERFAVLEELPDQQEKAFKILSKEALESPARLNEQYFNSYSSAKEFLQTHWPKEQQASWQILQAESKENEEMVNV